MILSVISIGHLCNPKTPWAKVKYDRQIIAIARVAQASAIYSDDKGIQALAKAADIQVIGLADLPLPPETAQGELPLAPPPAPVQEAPEGTEGTEAVEESPDETLDQPDDPGP